MRVFCVPYAGAGASAFRAWPNTFPDDIELCSLQPAGRERRIAEPLAVSMPDIVNPLVSDIVDLLDVPFAFFGHSMGALVAFEATRELARRNLGQPVHLIVSGVRAPRTIRRTPELHRLPDAQRVAELRRLGGTPSEVLAQSELLAIILPVLRADLTAYETYEFIPDGPLACPISAWGGRSDRDLNDEELVAWGQETTGPFTVRHFDGGHFYLIGAAGAVTSALADTLARSPDVP